MTTIFPTLEQFAAAYFHQDWAVDSTTAMDVVRAFRDRESATRIGDLVREIEFFIGTLDEKQIDDLWLERWGAEYDPTEDGMTYREWFQRVLEVLREPR